MKNGKQKLFPAKPSVKEASRRLGGILARSNKLGLDVKHLDSVSALRQACGSTKDNRVLLATSVLSLMAGVLVLVLACGHLPEVAFCKNNSSKEIHIETMSWNRLPEGGRGVDVEEPTALSDLDDAEEQPLWQHNLRLRRER